MIYTLDEVELDLGRVELRRAGEVVAVEPQVFSLLSLLIENHDRMVSRDEIVERVWDGRIVSEAAISSRVKAARRAIGDDGVRQSVIKTIHGRGFRCVANVRIAADRQAVPAGVAPLRAAERGRGTLRPSIAVLPFPATGLAETQASLGDAIPHEVISALSRLRWLKVISRGSSFRFREKDPDAREVGRALGARYCVTGMIVAEGRALNLSVELADTRDGTVVWSDSYRSRVDDIQAVRREITVNLVATLERQLAINEAVLAQMGEPGSLDAWALFHLGLQRMFRFSASDNLAAAQYFSAALEREPGLARAHAAMSFTEFQNAYLGYATDREASVTAARRSAEQAYSLDPLDPFASFTLGRSHWLSGDIEASLGWLDQSFALSPSYAQGIYARAWADTMLGRPDRARGNLDSAMSLSPLDPFLFAMKGTRALGFLIEERLEEAVRWIDDAGRSPGANAVVHLVAAATHEMNGERDEALYWVKGARARNPLIDTVQLFQSLPFAERALRQRMTASLGRLGVG